MQTSGVEADVILEWLQKEMDYRPHGSHSTNKASSPPSVDSLRKICRGNMIPVWIFLLKKVKSEKTVDIIRQNILVHGVGDDAAASFSNFSDEKWIAGRNTDKQGKGAGADSSSPHSRNAALHDREVAEKEVEVLINALRRQRKEVRSKMLEVSREEAERKRMLDERSNYRHKQVTLDAFHKQCEESAKIFSEYQKLILNYVKCGKEDLVSNSDNSIDVFGKAQLKMNEQNSVYSTAKDHKSSENVIFIETTTERSVRKACEIISDHIVEKLHDLFPAYSGSGIHPDPQLEASNIRFGFSGEIPSDIRYSIMNCLINPPQLLEAMARYTLRLKNVVARETEHVGSQSDSQYDEETLRGLLENNRGMDFSSLKACHHPQHHLGKNDIMDTGTHKGNQNQLLERQKAHVQKFMATEDSLNKAEEAKILFQKLLKRLHDRRDAFYSHLHEAKPSSQHTINLRQIESEVHDKEREAAGLRACVTTLLFEVQRLNKLFSERKEAEDSLKKKWRKIEQFDARRYELEIIYSALLKANMDAGECWNNQSLAVREYAISSVLPSCSLIVDAAIASKDLIHKEVFVFYKIPDNSLCMFPTNPKTILESIGVGPSSGPELLAVAEKHAAVLSARVGAGDPSAIPSICRISAALQYPAKGSDAGLGSVLGSLEFCLKFRGSEANILEDLEKAINLVHSRRCLVESSRTLLIHASQTQQDYNRTTNHFLNLSANQEKDIFEKWLPKLRSAVSNSQAALKYCRDVTGLLDEWWEQPASTVVDWITVDGQSVAAWNSHVKKLLAFHDKELV